MIACSDINEFINLIQEKKFLIYGAGYVADIFVEALQKHGLEKNIYGFVVTDNIGGQNYKGNFWVKQLSQINRMENMIVCIATHEVSKREIETTLLQRGILDYIWIYPFLYTLSMGKPVRERQWIDIRKMLPSYEELYGMAIRWAAIDCYYGNCQDGFYLYKKAMKIHCSEATAEERAKGFIRLMQNWDEYGYDAERQIAINLEYEIIDGEHRAALALYHYQKFLQCTIYNEQNIHKEKILMRKDTLITGGFTQEEIIRLDGIKEHIKSIVKEKLC